MRYTVFTILMIGVFFIVIGYVKQTKECPADKVEYRFIPRTFQEDQDNPTRVSELFDSMFREPTPWIRDVSTTPRKSDLNRYFISQA